MPVYPLDDQPALKATDPDGSDVLDLGGGGGAVLSTTAPPALADPADVGVGATAARDDHVHPLTGLATVPIQTELAAAAPFSTTNQEGGAAVLTGDFVAKRTAVEVDVDLSAFNVGWGGAHVSFALGVLPTPAPAGWEGKPANRLVKAIATTDTPLPGVTEFAYRVLGGLNPNVFTLVRRVLRFGGLTVGRTYTWELRVANLSGYKSTQLPAGSTPTYPCLSGDEKHAWVTCTGDNRLRLIQLGYEPYWSYFAVNPQPAVVGAVPMPTGAACRAPSMQPVTDRYVAVVDGTANKLVIVDSDTMTVVGSYAPTGSPVLDPSRAVWQNATHVWVGTYNTGKLHRFNVATLAFDASITVNAAGFISALALDPGGSYLWVTDFFVGNVYRVNLSTLTAGAVVYALGDGGPVAGKVRPDGSLAFIASTTTVDHVTVVSSSGVWQGYLNLQNEALGSPSVALNADGTRCYFTHGTRLGWGWLSTFNVINDSQFHGAVNVGEMVLTSQEGAVYCRPTGNVVAQWPGGTTYVRPDPATPGSFGTEHAVVTVHGGTSA